MVRGIGLIDGGVVLQGTVSNPTTSNFHNYTDLILIETNVIILMIRPKEFMFQSAA